LDKGGSSDADVFGFFNIYGVSAWTRGEEINFVWTFFMDDHLAKLFTTVFHNFVTKVLILITLKINWLK